MKENDLIKRFVTKDGSKRISFYQENDACSPREMTDEPLHCEDWSRDYSIMSSDERKSRSSSAHELLEYFLKHYGDSDKIIRVLVENGKHKWDGKRVCDNALVYDRSAKRWVLEEYGMLYKGKGFGWQEVACFDCKKTNIDIDVFEILESVSDSTIDLLIEQECLTDKVKMMSYSFGYCGEISFSEDVSCNSEGICWLEKDEFLKYSGCDEDYWNGKALTEIEWLLDELVAWSIGDVYGYIVENAIRSKVHKEHINADREDEDYEEEEWEEIDSSCGFYGDPNDNLESILEFTGFKSTDLDEI